MDIYKEELGKPYSEINLFLCNNIDFQDQDTENETGLNGNKTLESSLKIDMVDIDVVDKYLNEDILINYQQNTDESSDSTLHQQKIVQQLSQQEQSSQHQQTTPQQQISQEENGLFLEHQQEILHQQNESFQQQQQELYSQHQTTQPQEIQPVNTEDLSAKEFHPGEPETLSEIFEAICKYFEGDVDSGLMYVLHVRRRNIWVDTNLKLKRMLAQGLKLFRVKFVGEMGFDAGGPKREFFTLIFEDAAKHVMQGGLNYSYMTLKSYKMVTFID